MTAAKTELIQEIQAIYRDHKYRPKGKPLSEYSEEQLRRHLDKLQAGAYGWMQGKAPSPRPYPARGEREIVPVLIKALEFYADPANWETPSTGFEAQYDPAPSPIRADGGKLARAAMAEATQREKEARP